MITNNKAIDTLRDRGLRLTRPRRIILDVVRATDAHPTAAFVYRRVRRRLPRVSLATVYRNLRVLAAEGFLAERADAAGLRFDGNAEPGHAFGHLDFLKEVGDPVTDEPIGKTEKNLKSAVAGETYEYTQMYPGMAKTARDEGLA